MAEEAHYAAPASESLKRKYDEPPTHRPTGFSSPHSTVSDIELAKQKAQEVAARLFSGAPPPPIDLKRPKPDNAAPPSSFDSIDLKAQYPVSTYQTSSKKIDIPSGRVGVIIGKGGETIKSLQLRSGAKIQVTRDMDADPNSPNRLVELMGSPEAIADAEKLINEVLAEAESGGSGMIGRRLTGQSGSADEFSMQIPNNKVGLIIGKGGETIKSMQAESGARIQVIPLHLPPGDPSTERTLKIDGSPEQIESAKQLVNQIINGENRPRNSGGYSQQGYQSRPPSSWAPPAPPMQQPGYGYMQPGAYSGQAPQYNMPQAQYPGYPPQQAGGYSTNWDQSTAPPNQPTAGGYDYYSQQPQQQQNPGGSAASADGSTYNYSQPPSSGYNHPGQGYGQDGYSAYNAPPQSGYGQPPTYDQQQGYGSAPSYGSSNPAQEGNTSSYGAQGDSSQAPSVQPSTAAAQGYATNQQPNSTSQQGYGAPPPTSQAAYGNQQQSGYGYGPPQPVKPSGTPPVYGQSQSPSTAGGYGQSAYPPAQPSPAGYAQPDQKAPASGYGVAAQPGYGPQSYGAPQGSYGQAPPSYGNSSYGAGYAQTPAYASDGTNGAPAQAAAAAQQGGVAKASPQS
ncbi:uncharacterized protein LOC130724532 [Lotus japonicus]|uniref:uncharacterized protein LOC130724532 n=1 Tax=Lotus japonicus TaxID=34305 RepID=UPI0025856355|nr:uncharacterized protein LOC130724532 [Lotus japonicus]